MAWPRCKRCNNSDTETNEWFGPGHKYHKKHLCIRCFIISTKEVSIVNKET